ncbi:OmpA family protein [Roseivivax sp. CAU 1761]
MSAVAMPQFGQQDPMGASSAGEAEAVVEYEERPEPSEEARQLQGELQEALKKKDGQSFAELEEQIVQAMNEVPDLKPLIPHVIFDQTEEGLRVQIIDQEGQSMFDSGSAVVGERTKALLRLIGEAISKLPNDVLISGHTDAVPFGNERQETGYGNWELSADRANATRRVFINSGITAERVVRVSGLADTDPFDAEDPRSPTNRRISVVLGYSKAPSPDEIDAALNGEAKEDDAHPEAAPRPHNEAAPRGHGKSGPETIDLEGLRQLAECLFQENQTAEPRTRSCCRVVPVLLKIRGNCVLTEFTAIPRRRACPERVAPWSSDSTKSASPKPRVRTHSQ